MELQLWLPPAAAVEAAAPETRVMPGVGHAAAGSSRFTPQLVLQFASSV